jgi:hypothetical protein
MLGKRGGSGLCIVATMFPPLSRRSRFDTTVGSTYVGGASVNSGVTEALLEHGDALVSSLARDIVAADASWMRSASMLALVAVLRRDERCVRACVREFCYCFVGCCCCCWRCEDENEGGGEGGGRTWWCSFLLPLLPHL